MFYQTAVYTKNWVEINNDSHGSNNTDSQIKFKTMTLKSSLYDYCDAYILAKGTTTVPDTAPTSQPGNNNGIEVVFKNFAPFTNCKSNIYNTQIDNAKDIDIVYFTRI